jgi:hypothetical protein
LGISDKLLRPLEVCRLIDEEEDWEEEDWDEEDWEDEE